MNYIIVNLKNFTLAHEIYLYNEDNELINKIPASMRDLPELVVDTCKKYNVSSVSLMGNKNFSKKVGDNIKEINLAKYSLNINIQYV